jgi:hypothetical protein
MRVRDAARAGYAPPKLAWLSPADAADHLFLMQADRCAYLLEYAAGSAAGAAPLNQLIWDFKCAPSTADRDVRRARRKTQAMATLATCLRQAVPRGVAERWTWVPVPPSKQRGDPDYDDRLFATLLRAFTGYDLDARRLLLQRCSTPHDHGAQQRLPERTLYDALCLDVDALAQRPIGSGIILFDDVLASGKHFHCCERRLRACLPRARILGLFLMRRVPTRCRRSLGRAW